MDKETETKDYPRYWLPDAAYDVLKWVALVALPAVGWGYGQLAQIWALPLGGEVTATCSLAALVIGVLIGVSQLGAAGAPRGGDADE